MTIAKAFYVQCNKCGTPAQISIEGRDSARKIAAYEGFTVVGKHRDYCPECSGRKGYREHMTGRWIADA